MKKIFSLLLVLSTLCGFVFAQAQADPISLPHLTQWVTDFSHTLTTSQLTELNATAKDYETATTNQVVAVVFPNRNGNELIDIGMKIFTENAIGKKDINNGLLLLIASEEKKIRIVVGYGLEGVYPDLLASQVIENDVRPLVNSGDIAGAIKIFYERSQQIIGGEIPVGYTTSTGEDNSSYIAIFIGFFLGLGLKRFLKGGFKKLKKSVKKWTGIGLSAFFLFAFLVGIYLAGTFLLYLFFGIIFGVIGIIPGFGSSFGAGGFSSGGGGGGFGGGGGGSGGGGAGD